MTTYNNYKNKYKYKSPTIQHLNIVFLILYVCKAVIEELFDIESLITKFNMCVSKMSLRVAKDLANYVAYL